MTVTGDFAAEGDDFDAPSYPTAFGITFTPKVAGILVGVVGLGAAAYLGTQLVLPVFEQQQTLRESIAQKELDLQQKAQTAQRVKQIVADLNQAKAENTAVRTLFSSQKALDTLLLDLNRVIVSNSAELLEFTPNYSASGPVTDGSLGPALNNKLTRQVTSVSFRGTFGQTLKIMQAIDRLQTVLVVQDLSVEVKDSGNKQTESLQNLVTSKFKLYAYVPINSEGTESDQPAGAPNQNKANQKEKAQKEE